MLDTRNITYNLLLINNTLIYSFIALFPPPPLWHCHLYYEWTFFKPNSTVRLLSLTCIYNLVSFKEEKNKKTKYFILICTFTVFSTCHFCLWIWVTAYCPFSNLHLCYYISHIIFDMLLTLLYIFKSSVLCSCLWNHLGKINKNIYVI